MTRPKQIKFRTILMDPPWYESPFNNVHTYGGGKVKRGVDKHYPLIKHSDMLPTITNAINGKGSIHDDAHCYIWVTNNFLKDGLELMEQLGFRYITNITWVKDRFGLGQYFRSQHELMLFGVRGKFYRNGTPECSTVIQAKRTKHSRKPVEAYKQIESISSGPYLELFARNLREGWISWGNEIDEDNNGVEQTRLNV